MLWLQKIMKFISGIELKPDFGMALQKLKLFRCLAYRVLRVFEGFSSNDMKDIKINHGFIISGLTPLQTYTNQNIQPKMRTSAYKIFSVVPLRPQWNLYPE